MGLETPARGGSMSTNGRRPCGRGSCATRGGRSRVMDDAAGGRHEEISRGVGRSRRRGAAPRAPGPGARRSVAAPAVQSAGVQRGLGLNTAGVAAGISAISDRGHGGHPHASRQPCLPRTVAQLAPLRGSGMRRMRSQDPAGIPGRGSHRQVDFLLDQDCSDF